MTTNPPAASDGRAHMSRSQFEQSVIGQALSAARARAAGDFTDSQHQGQRGCDWDAGFIAACRVVEANSFTPPASGAGVRRPALPVEAEHLPGCEHPRAPAWICECPRPVFAPTAEPEPAIPAGMVLVPRDPTEEMVHAGAIDHDHTCGNTKTIGYLNAGRNVRQIYAAMVAAAPTTRAADYATLERDFNALRRDYGRAALLIQIMRERWTRVSAELDHIEGGMFAGLEDAASEMASACDDPVATLAAAAPAAFDGGKDG